MPLTRSRFQVGAVPVLGNAEISEGEKRRGVVWSMRTAALLAEWFLGWGGLRIERCGGDGRQKESQHVGLTIQCAVPTYFA